MGIMVCSSILQGKTKLDRWMCRHTPSTPSSTQSLSVSATTGKELSPLSDVLLNSCKLHFLMVWACFFSREMQSGLHERDVFLKVILPHILNAPCGWYLGYKHHQAGMTRASSNLVPQAQTQWTPDNVINHLHFKWFLAHFVPFTQQFHWPWGLSSWAGAEFINISSAQPRAKGRRMFKQTDDKQQHSHLRLQATAWEKALM